MRNHYWLAMDDNCVLHVYCDDCKFHPLYPVPRDLWERAPFIVDASNQLARKPRPWKFDGSECVTADCLPSWALDSYYVAELPKSFVDCSGR